MAVERHLKVRDGVLAVGFESHPARMPDGDRDGSGSLGYCHDRYNVPGTVSGRDGAALAPYRT